MYALLGICLTLAALLTLNTLASLAATIVWRGIKGHAQRWSALSRARLLFTLRVFPPLGAFLCVAALILPAYLIYEPRATGETVSLKLAAIPLLSAVGLAVALWRWLMAWRATRQLTMDWLRQARPIHLDCEAIPAYRIHHAFPIIAIVGVLKPRLFIADRVFQSLSREEITAAIAHENGHLVAHDNLKRGLLRVCRDVLTILPCGRRLDRAWAEASESAADEHAAQTDAETALDLASALVKIARLVPAGMRPSMPASASLLGDNVASISERVHRLAQLAEMAGRSEARSRTNWRIAPWIWLSLPFTALALLTTYPRLLVTVHELTERIVTALR